MNESTRRLVRKTAWVLVAAAALVSSYLVYEAYIPKSADFALYAKTERVVLKIANGAPAFGWHGLELATVDGVSSICLLKPVQFGAHALNVTLTVFDVNHAKDANDGLRLDRPQASVGAWTKVLRVRFDSKARAEDPISLTCVGGRQIQFRKSADLWLRGQSDRTVNLPVYAEIEVGGLVDSHGGPMWLLRSGTLRASSRLKGSRYMPASNQLELHPGDQVSVIPDSADRESLSVGVLRFDGSELDVTTHARGAFVEMRRAGLESAQVVSLPPGILSMLQSVPLWGVLTLLCTFISGLIGILASRSRGASRTK